MRSQLDNKLKVSDIVTHTGKRGFWSVNKSYKGIGLVMSSLYKKYEKKFVHDVWFVSINQMQQIGAGALEKINQEEIAHE